MAVPTPARRRLTDRKPSRVSGWSTAQPSDDKDGETPESLAELLLVWVDNCCIERPENLVWHGICCDISGWSTLYAHSTHKVDRKRLHPPCNLCVEKTNKNSHMAVKPPSPRQALLKRKKPKPLRVRVDGDWYDKAYMRFSISAKTEKQPASPRKNVELNDD